MVDMLRDDLLDRLQQLDEEASLRFDGDGRFRIVIVGGGALILLEVIERATHDMDALDVSPEIREMLEKYDINCRVQTYINNFPYNYEDRLHRLPIDGDKIDFYTASLEDIVIAKLCSIRETDRQDIIEDSVVSKIDWELLDKLAKNDDEIKANMLNDRNYKDFLSAYAEYVRIYRR